MPYHVFFRIHDQQPVDPTVLAPYKRGRDRMFDLVEWREIRDEYVRLYELHMSPTPTYGQLKNLIKAIKADVRLQGFFSDYDVMLQNYQYLGRIRDYFIAPTFSEVIIKIRYSLLSQEQPSPQLTLFKNKISKYIESMVEKDITVKEARSFLSLQLCEMYRDTKYDAEDVKTFILECLYDLGVVVDGRKDKDEVRDRYSVLLRRTFLDLDELNISAEDYRYMERLITQGGEWGEKVFNTVIAHEETIILSSLSDEVVTEPVILETEDYRRAVAEARECVADKGLTAVAVRDKPLGEEALRRGLQVSTYLVVYHVSHGKKLKFTDFSRLLYTLMSAPDEEPDLRKRFTQLYQNVSKANDIVDILGCYTKFVDECKDDNCWEKVENSEYHKKLCGIEAYAVFKGATSKCLRHKSFYRVRLELIRKLFDDGEFSESKYSGKYKKLFDELRVKLRLITEAPASIGRKRTWLINELKSFYQTYRRDDNAKELSFIIAALEDLQLGFYKNKGKFYFISMGSAIEIFAKHYPDETGQKARACHFTEQFEAIMQHEDRLEVGREELEQLQQEAARCGQPISEPLSTRFQFSAVLRGVQAQSVSARSDDEELEGAIRQLYTASVRKTLEQHKKTATGKQPRALTEPAYLPVAAASFDAPAKSAEVTQTADAEPRDPEATACLQEGNLALC